MPELTTDKLADLIDRRLACLTQLQAIGRRQSALINGGEIAETLRLLAGKQQLIATLERIEGELQPFRDQEPDARAWASDAARRECSRQAAECRRLLEEVMRLEQANERAMTIRRDEVSSQLQSATAAMRASGAYRTQRRQASAAPATYPANEEATRPRIDLCSQ